MSHTKRHKHRKSLDSKRASLSTLKYLRNVKQIHIINKELLKAELDGVSGDWSNGYNSDNDDDNFTDSPIITIKDE